MELVIRKYLSFTLRICVINTLCSIIVTLRKRFCKFYRIEFKSNHLLLAKPNFVLLALKGGLYGLRSSWLAAFANCTFTLSLCMTDTMTMNWKTYLKKMAQEPSSQSWNRMFPSVVSAVKSGTMSPKRRVGILECWQSLAKSQEIESKRKSGRLHPLEPMNRVGWVLEKFRL